MHIVERAVALIAMLLISCTPAPTPSPSPADGGTDSIAGRYACLQPGASEADDVELREDGTLTISQPALGSSVEGTWSMEGGAGVFTVEGQDEPFTIDDERLVFEDGTICTKAG